MWLPCFSWRSWGFFLIENFAGKSKKRKQSFELWGFLLQIWFALPSWKFFPPRHMKPAFTAVLSSAVGSAGTGPGWKPGCKVWLAHATDHLFFFPDSRWITWIICISHWIGSKVLWFFLDHPAVYDRMIWQWKLCRSTRRFAGPDQIAPSKDVCPWNRFLCHFLKRFWISDQWWFREIWPLESLVTFLHISVVGFACRQGKKYDRQPFAAEVPGDTGANLVGWIMSDFEGGTDMG